MQHDINTYEEITALVDNELSDERKDVILNMIDRDEDLQKEFYIQSDIKSMLKKRFANQQAPAYLYDSIMTQISSRNMLDNENSRGENKLKEFLTNLLQPKYVFAIITLFAVVFFLSMPFQTISESELVEKQTGQFNMWVQANSNFEKIINGELSAQIVSSNPQEIQNFFSEKGVDYSAEIPLCKNWDLLGGVVSEDKGTKFAHHVYADKDGHIVYVYQVSENYFTSQKVLDLSNDLMTYISEGNVVKHQYYDHVSFILKSHDKIFTVVANENPGKIESDLISQLL